MLKRRYDNNNKINYKFHNFVFLLSSNIIAYYLFKIKLNFELFILISIKN